MSPVSSKEKPKVEDNGDVTPASSTLGWWYYASAALAAVLVVCVVTLVYLFASQASGSAGDRLRSMFGSSPDAAAAASDTDTRNAVLAAADQFVLRSNTYGPRFLNAQNKMPTYIAAVHAVTTPKLQQTFDQSVVIAEAQVSNQGVSRNVDLYATAVSQLTADNATVLATGELLQSSANPEHPKAMKQRLQYDPVPFRFILSMVKVDGEWLVDDFGPATGSTAGFGSAPTGTPSTPTASSSASASPRASAGASSGTAGR